LYIGHQAGADPSLDITDTQGNLPNADRNKNLQQSVDMKLEETAENMFNEDENKENKENEVGKPRFKLGVYTRREPPKIKTSPVKPSMQPQSLGCTSSPDPEVSPQKRSGPRTLRRRKGKMTRVRRRSSINGHWYDRETNVFTPPKHSAMSVWTTSLQSTTEVLSSLLNKYKIESEAANFGLYVIKDTGERRLITGSEFPLLLRVNLGPHEDIAKVYLMNKANTSEISHLVAQFLRFSYTELRSFVGMFYEEEEREADRIRLKYKTIKEIMRKRLQELKSIQNVSQSSNPSQD